MFGADTPMVLDALQMAGLAVVATGGAAWLLFRRRKSAPDNKLGVDDKNSLEERVQVLERIATDPAKKLADEIDQLGGTPSKREKAN